MKPNQPFDYSGFSGGWIQNVPTSQDPVALAVVHARRAGRQVRSARRNPAADTPEAHGVDLVLPGGFVETVLIPKDLNQ